jgi:hypothetical protein
MNTCKNFPPVLILGLSVADLCAEEGGKNAEGQVGAERGPIQLERHIGSMMQPRCKRTREICDPRQTVRQSVTTGKGLLAYVRRGSSKRRYPVSPVNLN